MQACKINHVTTLSYHNLSSIYTNKTEFLSKTFEVYRMQIFLNLIV